MFRARFKVNHITRRLSNSDLAKHAVEVEMYPLKDEVFGPATPQGKINMLIFNDTIDEQLRPGQVFDITFTEHHEEK